MDPKVRTWKKLETIPSIAWRGLLYGALFAVVGFLPALDVSLNLFGRDLLFAEFSFVQFGQVAALVACIIAASRLVVAGILPHASAVIVGLLSCAVIRESDAHLDRLADGLWQALLFAILAGTAIFAGRYQSTINQQIAWLTSHYSLGFIIAGFISVVGFARVFGRGAMWQQIMGDSYTKSVKYFAEESVELLGYTLLMIGIIEFSMAAVRQFR